MLAAESSAAAPRRRRARLPVAMGAMLAALGGVLMFPFMAYAYRSPAWPMVAVAVVALGGGLGGGLYHVLQRIPLRPLAQGLGVLVYLAVTAAAFVAVLDGPA